jgi:spore coat protein U-like protein
MRRAIKLLASFALFASPSAAMAATAQTTFTVTANVVGTCTVLAGNLTFPNYTGVVDTANSTIQVNCSGGGSFTPSVALDAGLNGTLSGSSTVRNMSNGGLFLPYNLYSDTSHTSVWANGTAAIGTTITAPATSASLTVYGQIVAGLTPPSGGIYSDTITVTVTY